ncbi:MAG: histone deacetylase family protein [Hyphomonadaceae bacterium]|nr:histone deacetylase family protein [Hyphomonadaceae bacterium]
MAGPARARYISRMLLYTHPSMLTHEPPPGHAEHAGRLKAVLDALERFGLDRREAPYAERDAIARVHPARYIDALEPAFAEAREKRVRLDPDTYISAGSREAAYRAAGACVAAVDAVMAGEDAMAFCAVRPPGHHAEPMTPMGFCIFNNVAIAAMHALEAHGLGKVAVVDFDVHHGNGTQTIAEREPRLFFASTHQSPLYPGTGAASETGIAGNVVNAPLPAGAGGGAWRRAMETRILPALDAFAPELILVSAGFDAHAADPLAQMELEAEDFAWAARELRAMALRHCGGKLVSTLEGGYDLAALAGSAAAYLAALQRD